MRKFLKNDKGVTLVELIISVAIMSIVILGICSLIVFCQRMFAKSTYETKAQTRSQLLESQLTNMIIDVEKSIVAGTAADAVATIGTAADAYVVLYNKGYAAQIVAYDGTSHELSYAKTSVDPTTKTMNVPTAGDWEVLADSVTSFSANSANVVTNRIFDFNFEVEAGTSKHKSVQQVHLRNDVKNTANFDDVYTPEDLELSKVPNAIKIKCDGGYVDNLWVEKGNSSGTFTAEIDSNAGVLPDSKVTWELKPSSLIVPQNANTKCTEDTSNNSCVCSIDENEGNNIFTLRAYSVDKPEIYGEAKIFISSPETILITASRVKTGAGTVLTIYGEVSNSHNYLSDTGAGVTWSIVSGPATLGAEYKTNVGGRSVSTVNLTAKSDAQVGDKIKVKGVVSCTAGWTTPVEGTIEIEIVEYKADDRIDITETTSNDGKIRRGDVLQLKASLDGTTVTDSNFIKWRISNYGGLDTNNIKISDTGLLTVAKDIDYSKSFTFEVSAKITYPGLMDSVEKKVTFVLDAVAVNFTADQATIVAGQSVRFPFTLVGVPGGAAETSITYSSSTGKKILLANGTYMYANTTELVVAVGSKIPAQTLTVNMTTYPPGSNASKGITSSVTVVIKDKANVKGTVHYVSPVSELSGALKAQIDNGDMVTVRGANFDVQYYKEDGNYYIIFNETTYVWDEKTNVSDPCWRRKIS